jgi:RecA/RadA recombinase
MGRKKQEEVAENIVETIEKGRKKEKEKVEFISTGCIPLNLAFSQKGREGGVPKGRITNFVGDGSSGKTLLSLEIAANWFYNYKEVKSNIFPEIKKLIIK